MGAEGYSVQTIALNPVIPAVALLGQDVTPPQNPLEATRDGGIDVEAVLEKPIVGGRYLFPMQAIRTG